MLFSWPVRCALLTFSFFCPKQNQSSTGFAPMVEPPESSVAMLVSMGFDGNDARQALMRARNDINVATNILLEAQSRWTDLLQLRWPTIGWNWLCSKMSRQFDTLDSDSTMNLELFDVSFEVYNLGNQHRKHLHQLAWSCQYLDCSNRTGRMYYSNFSL